MTDQTIDLRGLTEGGAHKIPVLESALQGRKLDQLAFYITSPEQARMVQAIFGLPETGWQEDIVTTRSVVYGKETENTARLLFNYSLGIEFELLQYLEGGHWHDTLANKGHMDEDKWFAQGWWMSHFGFHLNDEPMPNLPFPLVQESWTTSHTNPLLVEQRRFYHYRIYDIRPWSGKSMYLKFIKRVNGAV